jgi:UDP-N-acetylglucosamine--N-acetylmuramyl-(pentapeptide) pyrophosphoryl-undecaprenol N-acetylglucosamine transferase
MSKIIISGGGTGGHIYPAIAIANTLKAKNPATEILFVGAEGRMEMEKVPQAGFEIVGLPIQGLQRKLSLDNISFPLKLAQSILKARDVLKKFKPDVCVGVGGYASGPLLYAASAMGIPTLIQEQNSYAGLTNKWLAKRAKKICVAYPEMDKFFPPDKIVVTGNPVRKDIVLSYNKRSEGISFFNLNPHKKTLLIIGGSLGARTINQSILNHIDKLLQADIQVIWQTGKGYFAKIQEKTADLPKENLKISDFISRMDLAYPVADVVISRAGALSVSELCVACKPAILVPSPNVAEDHQTKNAMALVNENAAILIKDADAPEKLVDEAIMLLKDNNRQKILSENIEKLALPEATEAIAEEILKLI